MAEGSGLASDAERDALKARIIRARLKERAGETSADAKPEETPSSLTAFGHGIRHGAEKLFYGGAQLGARMGPEEGAGAFTDLTQFEKRGGEPISATVAGPTPPSRLEVVDQATAKMQQEYEDDPARRAHPYWAGAGDIGGEIVATAPLFAAMPVGALPTLGARIAGAALPGSLIGTMQPVTSKEGKEIVPVKEGEYGGAKAAQVAESGVGAMVGQPVGEGVGALAGAAWRRGKRLFQSAETVAAEKAAARTEEAGERITARVTEAQKGGRMKATDVMQEMADAREAGQPFGLIDVDPRGPLQRLAGEVHRGPGGAGGEMEARQTARMTAEDPATQRNAQGVRLVGAIRDFLGGGSGREAAEVLIEQRATNARPLWDRAMAGGSIAPLEHQFTQEFQAASAAEAAAVQRLAEARTRLMPTLSRQQTASNVYSSSAANREVRAATQELAAAEQEVARIRQVKEDARTRLQRAQEDGTANAPGAVWSPRLQEFLNDRDFKRGLRRGWEIEKKNALAEGRPINAREYAIVGFDEAGDPIVGQVPNMKLLQTAKEGVDALLTEDGPLYSELTGKLTKQGLAIDKARRAFVAELDRLNPDYAPARAQWSGDTETIRALKDGRNAFKRQPTGEGWSTEDFNARWEAMPPGDREVFKQGAAAKLIEDLDFHRLTGNQANAVVHDSATRQRLRKMLGSEEDYDKFIRFVERERTMWETGTDVMRGSQTAVREAADEQAREQAMSAMGHAAHGLAHAKAGNWWTAVRSFLRAKQDLGWYRQDPEVNREIARLLQDPNVPLAAGPGGKLLVGPAATRPPPPSPTLWQETGRVAGRSLPGDIGAIVTPNIFQ